MSEQVEGTEKALKLPDEIRSQLNAPFPPEAKKPHPSMTYLTTIKAMYITERLNDVFGVLGWEVRHEIVNDSDIYVTVTGMIFLPEYGIGTPIQYGGHKKDKEVADSYKSAVTDLISKCASYLEIGIEVFKGETDKKPATKAPAKKAPAKAPTAKKEAAKPAEKKEERKTTPVEDLSPEEFLEKCKEGIDGYVDSELLKSEGETIIKAAQMYDDGEIEKAVRQMMNDKFAELIA